MNMCGGWPKEEGTGEDCKGSATWDCNGRGVGGTDGDWQAKMGVDWTGSDGGGGCSVADVEDGELDGRETRQVTPPRADMAVGE